MITVATASLATPTGPFVVGTGGSAGVVELSLILPTYKEAQNIVNTIEAACGVLRAIPSLVFEVIVVDDDSPDGTAQLALDASVRFPEVQVMRRKNEAGLATAVIRGWQAARGSVLAVMDADMQHPPETLAQLVNSMRSGCDLAVASRHVKGGGVGDWNIFRRIVSRGAQVIGLAILPEVLSRISDPMSGFFMVRRKCIEGVTLNPMGYKILIEVIARGRVGAIGEAGYIFCERTEGASKATGAIYLQYIKHLWRLRLDLLRSLFSGRPQD
jgi:Glycosyltransferases involved in cell wall biogenesis